MNPYRVEFHAKGAAETHGLPENAFVALYETLVAVARDPWTRSRADEAISDPEFRWAPFDNGLGVVHFVVDKQSRVIRVHGITWTG